MGAVNALYNIIFMYLIGFIFAVYYYYTEGGQSVGKSILHAVYWPWTLMRAIIR